MIEVQQLVTTHKLYNILNELLGPFPERVQSLTLELGFDKHPTVSIRFIPNLNEDTVIEKIFKIEELKDEISSLNPK